MTPAVRRRSSLVAAVAAALLLTGCTFGPTPVPTRSPDAAVPATPRPTPTVELEPIDPVTTVTEIVVRPEHLELVDSQGVLVATLSYDAEVSEFTGVLSTVLGGSPELTEHTASMETPATTEYTWSGVRVLDDHEEAVSANGLGGYPPIDMNVSVMFTGPRVGDGVAVRTVNGYQPGDDAQALAVELGEPWNGNGYDQVRVETGEPIGEQNFDEYENAYSVAVNTWEWRGASNVVFAPWNFGIGHV